MRDSGFVAWISGCAVLNADTSSDLCLLVVICKGIVGLSLDGRPFATGSAFLDCVFSWEEEGGVSGGSDTAGWASAVLVLN